MSQSNLYLHISSHLLEALLNVLLIRRPQVHPSAEEFTRTSEDDSVYVHIINYGFQKRLGVVD